MAEVDAILVSALLAKLREAGVPGYAASVSRLANTDNWRAASQDLWVRPDSGLLLNYALPFPALSSSSGTRLH